MKTSFTRCNFLRSTRPLITLLALGSPGFSEALIEHASRRPCGFADEELVSTLVEQGKKKDFALRDFIHTCVSIRQFQSKSKVKPFLGRMKTLVMIFTRLTTIVPLLPICAMGGEAEGRPPLLLANYYCWYHDSKNPGHPFLHWTYPSSETNELSKQARKPGEPPPNSMFRPLVGLYDSADPEVAEWHVQLAKAAGIDAFLVDWWDTHDALDQNVDRGIVAAADKHGFKFALLDERAQFHQNFEDYQVMLAQALKRYKDHSAYLRIDGRPVVYLYQVATKPGLTAGEFPLLKKHVESEVGPVYWIVDKIAHDAEAANAGDKDREKRIPEDWLTTPGVDCFAFYSTFSNFRAHEYDAIFGKYRYLTRLAHDSGKKMLLPVHPGHDNSRFSDDPYVMPRRDGQTLRDFLRAATDAEADYLMITSWNEWPESTVVEPSSTWSDPYQYLKVIAEWRGKKFEIPPTLVVPGKEK